MEQDDVKTENRRNYRKLLTSLAASKGILKFLIAVCDDRNLRKKLIQQYEKELQDKDFTSYRIRVQNHELSLTSALAKLIDADPDLQVKKTIIITVLGIDELLSVRLDQEKSEQEIFFGYLQSTRDDLRQFTFPFVLWLTNAAAVKLAQKAPDFWNRRGGVFWFAKESNFLDSSTSKNLNLTSATVTEPVGSLLLEEILQIIDKIEIQGKKSPLIATLNDSLDKVYQQRFETSYHRQLAIQAYKKAIDLQSKLNLKADLASSWKSLGNLYFEIRDNVKNADHCYRKALEIYRGIGSQLGEANTLKSIGDVLQFLHRSDEALSRYEQTLMLYRGIGSQLGEANTLKSIGDVLQFFNRSEEALSRYEQALPFYQETGSRLGEANTLKSIGDILQFLNRSEEALSQYEQTLTLYREIGNRLGEANTLKSIGDVLQFFNRSNEALSQYEQTLTLYREIGNRLGEANTLKAIGDVLQFIDRNDEALSRYEQALPLYQAIGSHLEEADTLKAIGDVLQSSEQTDEALCHYEKALKLYRETGSLLGEANTLKSLGDVWQFLDLKVDALSCYEQALELYQQTGSFLGEANTLEEFGKLQSDPKQGLLFLQQAQNIYEQIGDIYSQSRNLIYFLADVYLKMGDKATAVNSLILGRDLAAKMSYDILQEYAQNKLAEIQDNENQSD
jgi:tetratricopeptide (TPR) repeat protein